jgi:uncharacterized MAPEG superfamily protein
MTIDLWYLAYTAILTAALWIPYIACQVMTNGFLGAENYVDPAPRPVPLWGKRADRAYLNAVESFAPFAALVIVAHLLGKADAMTAFWAACFFWLRLTHAVVYMLGIPYIRTLVFTLGFVAVAGIFWEVVK